MSSSGPAAVVASVLWLASPSRAQTTELISIDSAGVQQDLDADYPPSDRFVSADGRYVVFKSPASNLVPGDTNGTWDVFIRDRLSGQTQRVSVDSAGGQSNNGSGLYGMSISADGRYVAFETLASNLVPGDTNGARDVFLHDLSTGTTELISLDPAGLQGNMDSLYPSVSGDGRYVAFSSDASNLVPGDTNGCTDVFVRDRLLGTVERLSVSASGSQGDANSYKTTISSNGRFVAFESLASNLVGGDTNASVDVFLRDRLLGTTRRASVASNGATATGHSTTGFVSDDGRLVAFVSYASDLVPGDTNLSADVFVHDFLLGTTERASLAWDGSEANSYSVLLSISGDGRYVLFGSPATNLVPGDTNQNSDVFLRDRVQGTTERVDLAADGTESALGGGRGAMSLDARYVVFLSLSSHLVPGDLNGRRDVFLRDRSASGFSSACDPGLNGVLQCPCANPPAGRGRGCENSAGTGGATLAATGIAYLAQDTLSFVASGERPTALSVLVQGDALISTGIAFGQGVRCVGGTLRRLYTKQAVGGVVVAPDLAMGDAPVSVRSALLGQALQAGTPYYYVMYYRDPVVLGGCSSLATFNCTQTGSVTYWP